jgi:AcrR family transcriptional regulator
MTDHSSETKTKIMDAARILFADQGFEGTSIREIAKVAEVNVASINYHFSNKENLFTDILHRGYVDCSQSMRLFYNSQRPELEELLVHFFRYFLNKSHDLISYFKMMMSTQHSHHLTAEGTEDELIGPPGAKVIVEAILKEVGDQLPDEDLHWAVKSLFSHVVHNSLMYNCCFKNNSIPFTSTQDIEKSIRRLCRIVIQDLKKI